jgi:hypothetical protein
LNLQYEAHDADRGGAVIPRSSLWYFGTVLGQPDADLLVFRRVAIPRAAIIAAHQFCGHFLKLLTANNGFFHKVFSGVDGSGKVGRNAGGVRGYIV